MSRNGLLIPTVAGYLGAKTRLVPKLLDLVSKAEYTTTFGDIFGGMGSTLINKSRHPVEIYNDLAVENYSIFKCFSDPEISGQFVDTIKNTTYSLETFTYYRGIYDSKFVPKIHGHQKIVKTLKKGLEGQIVSPERFEAEKKKADDEFFQWREDNILDLGITSLLLTKMTPRGLIRNKSFAGLSRGEDQQFENWKLNLDTYVERLNGVQVRNQDALEIIQEYRDDPHAIFICDSPYFGKETHHGVAYLVDSATQDGEEKGATQKDVDKATETFQRQYMATVQYANCHIIVCGYKNELYNEYLRPEYGWECICIDEIAKLAKNNGKGEMRDRVREYVWVNYNVH